MRTSAPPAARRRSTCDVVPGMTVLRKISSASWARCGASSSITRSMSVVDGFMNSSMGVPMTTMMVSTPSTSAGDLSRMSRPVGSSARSSLVRAALHEGHPPGGDAVERRLGDVQDAHPKAGLGQGKGQRQAHMPPPPTTTTSGGAGRDRADVSVSPIRGAHHIRPASSSSAIQGMTSSSIWSSVVVGSEAQDPLGLGHVGDADLDVVLEGLVRDGPKWRSPLILRQIGLGQLHDGGRRRRREVEVLVHGVGASMARRMPCARSPP